MMSPVLVLTTVNAPFSQKLDATEIVHCLLDPAAAKAMPGHMSLFFGEVKPRFADRLCRYVQYYRVTAFGCGESLCELFG